MTSLFDGMGPLLRDVFGGEVTITPQVGDPYTVTAIVRAEPVEISDEFDGPAVSASAWVLKVSHADAPALKAGDDLTATTGGIARQFRITHPVEPKSPAADALREYELELLAVL